MISGKFHVLGESVLGASHATKDKPCQDALSIRQGSGYVIACVADGHGSKNCPYSDEGSKAAVQIATDLLDSILKDTKEAFKILDGIKEIWLPKQLEERWKKSVREIHHHKTENFQYELYGTTLLALAATKTFVFALQIGDGDIITVNPMAQEIENMDDADDTLAVNADWLIPSVESVGSETESLCMENCWQYVRTRILPLKGLKTPLMFLLSTDGYANSFTASAGFLKAGKDIYNLWKNEGADYVQSNLRDWLERSTAEGSGDDITVALVLGK